ncbi:MAG TPA: hypothetical protein PK771_14990, partial [Spirochaetota bacterium]|nr:hypothetical protein [Spirochaetota bacterium]
IVNKNNSVILEYFLEKDYPGVRDVLYSPDNKFLACVCYGQSKDNIIVIWDYIAKQKVAIISDEEILDKNGILFSPNSKFLISGINTKELTLWETETGFKIKTFHLQNEVLSATFSKNSRYLAYCNAKGEIRFLDITSE